MRKDSRPPSKNRDKQLNRLGAVGPLPRKETGKGERWQGENAYSVLANNVPGYKKSQEDAAKKKEKQENHLKEGRGAGEGLRDEKQSED